ncbi:stalk domain-containing protein [Paenibacillus sp. GCM10027626]|uniref:stalk domain-containing protein n=1 Tax=Paenibacillus sp. GCM10027626 TaxID=3273411 RepID=UPI00363E3249
MRKYLVTVCFLAVFLVFSTTVSAAESFYKVYVDGNLATSSALTKNGSTIVPFRSILSKLNFNVKYNAAKQSIEAYNSDVTIKLNIGSKRAIMNGAVVQLPVAPQVIGGSTYIPLRFISESMNYRIELDKAAQTIYIDSRLVSKQDTQTPPATTELPGTSAPPVSASQDETETQTPSSAELTTKKITEMNDGKVFVVLTDEMQGSAVSLGQGLFLTNYHVVEEAKSAEIVDIKGKKYALAGLVDYDKKKDLAIVKTKTKMSGLAAVAIGDPGKLAKGERVVAIGTPLGQQNTVSEGVISNLITKDGVRLLQISVPIDHGSSGGGLFNTQGELVGITTSGIESQANLNFAVSVSEAAAMIGKVANRDFADISTTSFPGAAQTSKPQPKPSTPPAKNTNGPQMVLDALNGAVGYIPTVEGDIYLSDWELIPGDAQYKPLIYTLVDKRNYMTYLEGYPSNRSIVKEWAEMIGEVTSKNVPGEAINIAVFFEDVFTSYPSSFEASEITKVKGGYEVSHIFISVRIDAKGKVTTIITD